LIAVGNQLYKELLFVLCAMAANDPLDVLFSTDSNFFSEGLLIQLSTFNKTKCFSELVIKNLCSVKWTPNFGQVPKL